MAKKLLKSMIDHTPGAVYIKKSTGGHYNFIWPACCGIEKCLGCIDFRQPEGCLDDDILLYDNNACDQVYFDHCEPEEAWLVLPHKNGKDYQWIQVDHKLELLEY